jgi:hypothetical protein
MNITRRKNTFLIGLILLWTLLVLSGYYWTHKPVTAENIQPTAAAFLDLLLALSVVTLAGGIGRRILPANPANSMEKIALQAAAGAGILSFLWLLLGLLPLYRSWTAWIVLGVGGILFWKDSLAWLLNFRQFKNIWHESSAFERILAAIILVLLLNQLIFALAPPVKYDALSYHLQLPRQYIDAGRFIFLPQNPYWGQPQLVEMLYTWMMLLFNAQAASVFGWCMGIIVLIGVFGLTMTAYRLYQSHIHSEDKSLLKANPGRAGWMAVVVLLAGYTVRSMLSWSYVDLFTALFGLGVLSCIMAYLQTRSEAWLLWAGVFVGLAVDVKWTAVVIAVGLYPFLFFIRKQLGIRFKTLLISAGFAAALALPWFLKNFIFTSNPVFPYFIPTNWYSAQRLSASDAAGGGLSFWSLLSAPFTSTIFGWDSAPGFSTDLGPLLLLFAIPGLWIFRREMIAKMNLSLFGVGWAVLIASSLFLNHMQQTRLYFVLLPAAAVTAGMGWGALQAIEIRRIRLRRVLAGLVLLVLALVLRQDFASQLKTLPLAVIMGEKSEQAYLQDSLGWYWPAVEDQYNLPTGSKVLMLWESRGYYAPSRSEADLWIDRWRVDYWKYGDPQVIKSQWIQEGFTHLLIYKTGMEMVRSNPGPLDENGWQALDALLASLPEPVSYGDVYYLYPLINQN